MTQALENREQRARTTLREWMAQVDAGKESPPLVIPAEQRNDVYSLISCSLAPPRNTPTLLIFLASLALTAASNWAFLFPGTWTADESFLPLEGPGFDFGPKGSAGALFAGTC